jgi:hypothetical protein
VTFDTVSKAPNTKIVQKQNLTTQTCLLVRLEPNLDFWQITILLHVCTAEITIYILMFATS